MAMAHTIIRKLPAGRASRDRGTPSPRYLRRAARRPRMTALGLPVLAAATVKVTTFVFAGNTLVTDDELRQAVREFEGRELTAREIAAAANAAKSCYQSRGYTMAAVVVPAQQVRDGALRLEVREGTISALTFRGNSRYQTAFLTRQLPDLAAAKVFCGSALERGVLILNSSPGLRAQPNVVPHPAAGECSIEFAITEQPSHWSIASDNYAGSGTGFYQDRLQYLAPNTTGRGDDLFAELLHSQDKLVNGERLLYSLPVGAPGNRLGLTFLHAGAEMVRNSPLQGMQTDVTFGQLQWTHPLLLSFSQSLLLNAGVSRTKASFTLASAGLDQTGTVNLLSVSLAGMKGRPGADFTSAFVQLSRNFRRNRDGTRNDAEAGRLDLALGHEHWFSPQYSLFAFGLGVAAIDALPMSQQVTIGGPYCVRSYDVAEAMGDQGYLLKLEARRHFRPPGLDPLMLRVFVDRSGVRRKVPAPGQSRTDLLEGAGVGLVARLGAALTLRSTGPTRSATTRSRTGRKPDASGTV